MKEEGLEAALASSWMNQFEPSWHNQVMFGHPLPILNATQQFWSLLFDLMKESATWQRDPLVCQRGTLGAVPPSEESEKCEKPIPFGEANNFNIPLLRFIVFTTDQIRPKYNSSQIRQGCDLTLLVAVMAMCHWFPVEPCPKASCHLSLLRLSHEGFCAAGFLPPRRSSRSELKMIGCWL